jgi:glycerol-3-phosphate dehydrogenase
MRNTLRGNADSKRTQANKNEFKRAFAPTALVMSSPLITPSSQAPTHDVLVVGGGINGAGVARDLAGRGLRVMLVEQDDLAAHTSSSSTKLIHGGLRYLEYYEFNLVRKALQEREVLLRSAPHIMWPLRFVMPHDPSMRPAWMIRIGLFLYDHLARRELLGGSTGVDLRKHPAGQPLQSRFGRGFVYSDGWVDDARLVVLNAIDARERGAQILTRTRCIDARRDADGWSATLQASGGAPREVRARALINAAGPWAETFLRQQARPAGAEALATRSLRLVKGSHIVVRRCFEHDFAYLLQNADKRIIFAIPYETDYTLIGTTDVEIQGDPGQAMVEAQEVAYLCEQASRYFERPVTPDDVVWRYTGVRPLLDDASGDPSAVTRDYLLESEASAAPLLSIWGGKITTFRKLAEDAADEVVRMLGERRPAWTTGATLPGGDLHTWTQAPQGAAPDFEAFTGAVRQRHPWLPADLARRLSRAYGTRIAGVLGEAATMADLGRELAPGLFERELAYLQREEWACSAEDVLWRRSKLGLHGGQAAATPIQEWLDANVQTGDNAGQRQVKDTQENMSCN